MIVSIFSLLDKNSREGLFEESFFLANVKPNIVLGMLFLTMSNVNVDFPAQNLHERSYTIKDILPTNRRVELMMEKEFVATALDLEHEAFVVHIAALGVNSGDELHPSKRAQIGQLKVNEAPVKLPEEYADFANIFLLKLVAKLLKPTGINNHAIKLVDN